MAGVGHTCGRALEVTWLSGGEDDHDEAEEISKHREPGQELSTVISGENALGLQRCGRVNDGEEAIETADEDMGGPEVSTPGKIPSHSALALIVLSSIDCSASVTRVAKMSGREKHDSAFRIRLFDPAILFKSRGAEVTDEDTLDP
ncbi:hypothetical protein NMY22_g16687 [Coprinellus aureogranulatus]|nr:hypothetical protein NMY22_g16687 [Coprinellus aureogranulatus]